jgi:hypothetical protein
MSLHVHTLPPSLSLSLSLSLVHTGVHGAEHGETELIDRIRFFDQRDHGPRAALVVAAIAQVIGH